MGNSLVRIYTFILGTSIWCCMCIHVLKSESVAPLPTSASPPYLAAMNNLCPFFFAFVLCLLTPQAFAADSSPRDIGRPDLAFLFAERGLDGCFVVQSGADTIRVNPERAASRFRPASTFKIVNALVALESGVAPDADLLLRWDGIERELPGWNRDLTLEQAFRVSAVWYYVELGRLNGRERLAAAMRALDYGNADATGSDQFWIDGPLRISADEQARMMGRLARGEAPFSARSLGLLRQIMLLDKGVDGRGAWALYAKTGMAAKGGGAGDVLVGWLVGFVERGGVVFPFALNISPQGGGKPGPDFGPARLALARALLGKLGILAPQ
jgi:beta-lactamase class D